MADFRGPELKLDRAEHHISDLHCLAKRFMDLQSYEVVANFDIKPGFISWVAHGKEPFACDTFAPVIGDAIHNLRDALDLAVSVLMRQAGESDEHVMFPTADSANSFQRALEQRPKMPNFPADLINVLKTRIQPYERGNGAILRALHKLSIMDKHRLIVPVVLGINFVHFGNGHGFIAVHVGRPRPIKNGGIIAQVRASDFPHVEVGHQAKFALAIALGQDCGVMRGSDVSDALWRFWEATKEAIDAMRVCLKA